MDYPYPAMHTEHVEPPGGGEQARMERERVDEKKRLKRAANRRSACTSRVRKKQFVEEMTAANERLAIYGAILARAPPTVTVDERCGLRFASRSARELLGVGEDEALDGLNLADLLAEDGCKAASARWLRAAAASDVPRAADYAAAPNCAANGNAANNTERACAAAAAAPSSKGAASEPGFATNGHAGGISGSQPWRPLEWPPGVAGGVDAACHVVSSSNSGSGGSDEARSGSDDGRHSNSEDSDDKPEMCDTQTAPAAPPDAICCGTGEAAHFPRKRPYPDHGEVVDLQKPRPPPPPHRAVKAEAAGEADTLAGDAACLRGESPASSADSVGDAGRRGAQAALPICVGELADGDTAGAAPFAAPDVGDGRRLSLVCRSGRVVVVDAVRGGSFASQPPGGAALQNPSGAPGSSLAIVPPSSCDDCDDYDDVVSEATQPPSPYHQAQLRPGHPSGGSPMATHHAAAPPFGQGPSSSGGGGGGGGGQYGTRGAFLRGASTESAATVDHAAAGAAPYGAPQGLPPAREKRETVLSLRVVEGGGGDDDGDGVHECLGKLSVGLPVRRDDASSLPGLNGAGQPSLLQPRDGAPPLPQMARSLSDPTSQSRHLRPQDVLDTLSGRSVPDLDPHLCGVLHDARDGRAPPPRAPRSPPKIEELCGGDTTPKDLQNVVDGLMLIANAGARR